MGLIGCPETSVRNYHYSLRNSPEERSSHVEWFMLSLTRLATFRHITQNWKTLLIKELSKDTPSK